MAMNFIAGYVMGTRAAGKAAGMATSAAQFSSNPTNKMYDLEDRIDRLTMIIQAMWSLIEEQGITAGDLQARVDELDGRDGAVDGRMTPRATTCPECGAKVGHGAGTCQFCGHDVGDPSPFAGM
jgi:hypothetical protein